MTILWPEDRCRYSSRRALDPERHGWQNAGPRVIQDAGYLLLNNGLSITPEELTGSRYNCHALTDAVCDPRRDSLLGQSYRASLGTGKRYLLIFHVVNMVFDSDSLYWT